MKILRVSISSALSKEELQKEVDQFFNSESKKLINRTSSWSVDGNECNFSLRRLRNYFFYGSISVTDSLLEIKVNLPLSTKKAKEEVIKNYILKIAP